MAPAILVELENTKTKQVLPIVKLAQQVHFLFKPLVCHAMQVNIWITLFVKHVAVGRFPQQVLQVVQIAQKGNGLTTLPLVATRVKLENLAIK